VRRITEQAMKQEILLHSYRNKFIYRNKISIEYIIE
jgi:hypothetical protein